MNVNRSILSILSVAMVLAVALSGCAPVRALSKPRTPAPQEVVESFYDWYLSYPGNVIADGAYGSSEYLTESFVEKVDETIASFDKGGYDPFLCAQDIPGDVVVDDEAVVSGGEATVVVHQVWNPGTEYESVHDLTVVLQTVNGQWRIADILCE